MVPPDSVQRTYVPLPMDGPEDPYSVVTPLMSYSVKPESVYILLRKLLEREVPPPQFARPNITVPLDTETHWMVIDFPVRSNAFREKAMDCVAPDPENCMAPVAVAMVGLPL
jgi:hypothetical protein